MLLLTQKEAKVHQNPKNIEERKNSLGQVIYQQEESARERALCQLTECF